MFTEQEIQELYQYAIGIVRENHIPVRNLPEKIRISSRMRSSWGLCRKNDIAVSSALLHCQSSRPVLETILHEMLHTCYGCMNHGTRWKSYADRLNARYGYCIKRTSSPAEMDLPEEIRSRMGRHTGEKKPAYCVVCLQCGQKIYRYKASKLVRHPDWYRCGRCRGPLCVIRNTER